MKLLIFGASGKTGRLLIQQALAKGYAVTAAVRSADKLADITDPHVTVRVVDVTSLESVQDAIAGQDVVCSALGASTTETQPILSIALQNIVSAMQKLSVKRLLLLSGVGADKSMNVHLIKRLMLMTILKEKYKDKAMAEQSVQQSNLDWTIIYATDLTDGPLTTTYRSGEHLNLGLKARVSRADVAHFMLSLLTDMNSIHKKIIVTS